MYIFENKFRIYFNKKRKKKGKNTEKRRCCRMEWGWLANDNLHVTV